MTPKKLAVCAASLLFTFAGPSLAVDFLVDEANSSVTIRVCPSLGCVRDESPMHGTMALPVAFDSGGIPVEVLIEDFALQLSEDVSFDFGLFTISGSGIGLRYAQAGTNYGPVPVTGGDFHFDDVPTALEGVLTGGFDLADLGTQSTDIEGSVIVNGDEATLALTQLGMVEDVDIGIGLADIFIEGTVVAHGVVPAPVPAVSTWAAWTLAALVLAAGAHLARRRGESAAEEVVP